MAYDGLTGSGGCQETADGVFGTTPRGSVCLPARTAAGASLTGIEKTCAPKLVINCERVKIERRQTAAANPEDRRRLFHQEIDQMEPSRLEVLNRVLQQLKLFELADQIDLGFAADRAAGRLSPEKVAEAVSAVRRQYPYA